MTSLSLKQLAALRDERRIRRTQELQVAEERVHEQRKEHQQERTFYCEYNAVAQAAAATQQSFAEETKMHRNTQIDEDMRMQSKLNLARSEFIEEHGALQASRVARHELEMSVHHFRQGLAREARELRSRIEKENRTFEEAVLQAQWALSGVGVEGREFDAEASTAREFLKCTESNLAAADALSAEATRCAENVETSLHRLDAEALEHERWAAEQRQVLRDWKAQKKLSDETRFTQVQLDDAAFQKRVAARRCMDCSAGMLKHAGREPPLVQRLSDWM